MASTKNPKKALEQVKEFAEGLRLAMKPILKQTPDLAIRIQRTFEETPEKLKILADYGWYIPLDFTAREVFELAQKIDSKDIVAVDDYMIKCLESDYSSLKKDVLERFSDRKKLLESAFWAHENSKFDLSIPVFFSQIDGICKDLIGSNFWGADKKNNFKPHTTKWAETINVNSVLGLFVEPLKHKGGLNKHHSEFNPIGITRHNVLHGENVDYGTATNSYKAISLLNYLADIVYKAVKEPTPSTTSKTALPAPKTAGQK